MISRAEYWVPGNDAYPHNAGRLVMQEFPPEYYPWAETQLQQATAISPQNLYAWMDLGSFYLLWATSVEEIDGSEHLGKAQAAIEQGLKINGTYPFLLRELGQIHGALGHLDSAGKYLEESILLDQTDAFSYLALGNVRLSQDRHDDAALAFMYARDLAPELPAPVLGLARTYLADARCDDAYSALQTLSTLDTEGLSVLEAVLQCLQTQD